MDVWSRAEVISSPDLPAPQVHHVKQQALLGNGQHYVELVKACEHDLGKALCQIQLVLV